jgi:hypothetical protein
MHDADARDLAHHERERLRRMLAAATFDPCALLLLRGVMNGLFCAVQPGVLPAALHATAGGQCWICSKIPASR